MGFRYTGIRVRDLDRSIAFYTTVLGMQVTWRMRIRETGGAIAVLKSPRGSQRLELNWYPPRGRYRVYRQGDELDHLAFAVPDVDRFLREHRGDLRVVMKAFDEGTDRLAYVTAPMALGSSSCRAGSHRSAPFAGLRSRSHGSIRPGNSTARPTIFPSRRSFSTVAASESGAFRVTTGLSLPASARATARARSAIVEEYEPRYDLPPSMRSFALTETASLPRATATNRPPDPRTDRPRSNVAFVPTKSTDTSAP